MSNVSLHGNTTQKQVYIWWSPDGLTMVPVSNTNPLPVTGGGGGGGGTSSVFGAAFPADGTAVGAIDASGNMAGLNLDGSGNLKVAGSFSASFTEATKDDTGSVSSAAVIFTQTDTTGYYSCFFQISGIGTSTVIAEVNNNGTWVSTAVQAIATPGALSSITSNGVYLAPTGALGFRLRVSVYDGISTIAANGFFRGFPISWTPLSTVAITAASLPLPAGASTEATLASFKSANHTDLAAINTTLGSPFQAGGSIANTTFASTQSGTWTVALAAGSAVIGHVILDSGSTTAVTQPTAASLNATVVGTGTFAVQAAQSGTWNVGLSSGSNLVGKFGIDQTTPGTTNAVSATNFPTTVDTNSGNKSASTLRVVLATDQPSNTNALKVDGSAVTQPVSGTVNQGAVTPVLKNGLTNTASSVVSSVAATLEDYYIYNPNASVAYVQIFDVATAGAVTVGTTTPKWSIGIPATSAANISRLGLACANGIQVAATTAATNGTAPGTALDANFGYR